METTSAAINLQLVDFFPFLRPWYQMAPAWLIPFKAVLRDIRILENRVFFELLELVKDKMKSGRVYPSKSNPWFLYWILLLSKPRLRKGHAHGQR